MENGTSDTRSCKETRSGSKIGRLEGVVTEKLDLDGNRRFSRRSCKETISGWEIGDLKGVITEKLGQDGK